MSKFITHLFYKGETFQPTLYFSDDSELAPLGSTLSLTFDLAERFCIGWHDMATGENHSCPEGARTEKKFETCPACQRRTGFNPAFYNTTKVSAKQEARNAEPHHLYLAYMGEGYIKVGISWHGRGIKRLLDQGARAGLVLETSPTALIARQYEAKIARLEGIHETTSTRTKLALLGKPFDETAAQKQLLATKQRIEQALSISFSGEEVLFFDTYYMHEALSTSGVTPLTDAKIAGKAKTIIGDILITQYDERELALPLRQFIGYPVEIIDEIIPLNLNPQQMQLF